MATVFISYRRGDANDVVEQLATALGAVLGERAVFWDRGEHKDGLKAGQLWEERLHEEIQTSHAVVAVIDGTWAGGTRPGERRIDASDDVVRRELELALTGTAAIVPVLLDVQPATWHTMLP